MNVKYYYRIVKSYSIVFIQVHESIQIEDIKTGMMGIYSDPDFEPKFSMLWDCRQCTLLVRPDELPDYFSFRIDKFKLSKSRGLFFFIRVLKAVVIW